MLIVIFMFIFCKDNNKKDDTMRDRNVKMWMNFSFLDKNVSDNEMDKKNGEYIKSGSLTALLKRPLSLSSLKRHVSIVSRILA